MTRFLSSMLTNFHYKLAALVIATIVWILVQGEEILEINRRVVVNIKPAPGYMVKGPATRIKDITIRGPRVLLGDVGTKPIEITISPPDGRTGAMRLPISRDLFPNWDNRVQLRIHEPQYVSVIVDQQLTKKVPVKEFLQGAPAEGTIIEKTEIVPATVTIRGLKEEVSKVKEVLTEPIDIAGLGQSKAYEARLAIQGFELADDIPAKATVNLLVGDKKINKKFTGIGLEIVGSDYSASVKPTSVSMVIQGTPAVLNFLKKGDLRAFIEARDLPPGRHEKHVQAKIPANTVLIETIPENVNVEVYNQRKMRQ